MEQRICQEIGLVLAAVLEKHGALTHQSSAVGGNITAAAVGTEALIVRAAASTPAVSVGRSRMNRRIDISVQLQESAFVSMVPHVLQRAS